MTRQKNGAKTGATRIGRQLAVFRTCLAVVEGMASRPPQGMACQDELTSRMAQIIAETVYERDDSAKLALLMREEAELVSRISAMRFSSLESFSILQSESHRKDLLGILMDYSDKQKMHVTPERPYLVVPLRSLAALEAVLSLCESAEEKAPWLGGAGYAVDHLFHLSNTERRRGESEGVRDAHICAWTDLRDDPRRLAHLAHGLFLLGASDDFRRTLESWQAIGAAAMKELVFLSADERLALKSILGRMPEGG